MCHGTVTQREVVKAVFRFSLSPPFLRSRTVTKHGWLKNTAGTPELPPALVRPQYGFELVSLMVNVYR